MNKRRRTGCLTCRARRIKCDEGKPFCERCSASNVECRGYEEKRQIRSQRSRRPLTPQNETTSSGPSIVNVQDALCPKFRSDSLPLVALPSNPTPSQRPHAGARHILAYHQYLFRTLSVLFPSEHLYFWRDQLCQKAWEAECVFNAIMALGTAHRATLLMSTTSENDKNRSADCKVIAVQAYTKSLQELSTRFHQIESPVDTLVGAVLLLAYFECFAGNVPAAYRHVRIASHYFVSMLSDRGKHGQAFLEPVECCLRKLGRLCRTVLPIPRFEIPLGQPEASMSNVAVRTPPPAAHRATPSSLTMLNHLYDLASATAEIEDLVWNPLTAYRRAVSAEKIYAFQQKVRKWEMSHSHLLPQLDDEVDGCVLQEYGQSIIDDLVIPPPAQEAVSPKVCLVAALCEFYNARAMWALSLLDNECERHELLAYIYFHRAMSWAATATVAYGLGSGKDQGEVHLPCETLDNGFLPMLYLIGQTTPRQSWLRWIIGWLNNVAQEGLFSGKALANCLGTLPMFEMCNNVESPLILERFPSSRTRVISVLLPEANGRSSTAYYASPRFSADQDDREQYQYYPLGSARWSNYLMDEANKPDIEFYSEERTMAEPFTDNWLLSQKAAQDWLSWAGDAQFDLDRVAADHMNGSQLLSDVDDLDA